jgi:phosphotransferase system IIB component
MFERIGDWFWNALTPDLVQDENQSVPAAISPEMLAALGGAANLKSCQPVALTRVRVELRDVDLLQQDALREAGVPALMTLPDGVFHLLLGAPKAGAATQS